MASGNFADKAEPSKSIRPTNSLICGSAHLPPLSIPVLPTSCFFIHGFFEINSTKTLASEYWPWTSPFFYNTINTSFLITQWTSSPLKKLISLCYKILTYSLKLCITWFLTSYLWSEYKTMFLKLTKKSFYL